MIFGLEQTARVLVTVSTSMLILISTDVGDFTWAFERFGAPPQVGFALTAALRFMPEMLSRTTLVLRAVELRGYDLSRPHLYEVTKLPDYVKRLARCVVLVTVPLLIGTLRGTATMAMVADARGFGSAASVVRCACTGLTAADVWGYAILIALVAGAFVLNHLHIGTAFMDERPPSCPAVNRGASWLHRPASPPPAEKETRCASTQCCSTTAAP